MLPDRYERGVAIFTRSQLELYGEPYHYGYDQYLVMEEATYQDYKTDFDFEKDRDFKMFRDKHRYCRIERFRSTFLQLCGVRGKICPSVLNILRKSAIDPRPEFIYESIRRVLKTHKFRKYYNRIGSLIHALGYNYSIILKGVGYETIERIFREFSTLFDRHKTELGRKYFPNLRYISLKLMEAFGAKFEYKLPFIRTRRKRILLDNIWQSLY